MYENMHLWRHLDRDGSGEVLCEEFIDLLFGDEDVLYDEGDGPESGSAAVEMGDGSDGATTAASNAQIKLGGLNGGGSSGDVSTRLTAIETEMKELKTAVMELTAAVNGNSKFSV